MSTQSSRGPTLRGNRRRKAALDLDLNRAPPGDNRDQEGTSTQVRSQGAQSRPQGNSVPPTMIDVEAIDDDVIESSPRAFAAVYRSLSFTHIIFFVCRFVLFIGFVTYAIYLLRIMLG